jgi:hypothetical protein
MRVFGQKQFLLSASLLFIAIALLLLCWLNAMPPIKPRGELASELYQYYTSVVPLYDTDIRKKFFMLVIAYIGFFAVALKLLRNKISDTENNTYAVFSALCIIGVMGVIAAYVILGFKASRTMIITDIGIAVLYLISASFCRQSVIKRMAACALYGLAGTAFVLLMCVIFKHIGMVSSPTGLDYILNFNVHFSALLSNSMRIADGYTWGNGILPSYGILFPEIASHLLGFSAFSIPSWLHFLQYLQILLICCFLLAAVLSTRKPITWLYVCCALILFDPSYYLLYFPNHGGWRYLGVAIAILALAAAAFHRKPLTLLQKILIGTLAFLINFETGTILIIGFCATELFVRDRGWLRVTRYVLLTALFMGLALFLFLHTFSLDLLASVFPFLGKLHNSSFGGEQYVVIPALVAVIIHAAIVMWRTANSGIRSAYQELGIVCAVYCLLWSMYFIDRPNIIYFGSISLVYAFLASRLFSDIRWLMGSLQKFAIIFVFFLAFAYMTIPLQILKNYRSQLSTPLVAIDHYNDMVYMNTIRKSAQELKENIAPNDGYVTPFAFFVRCLSRDKNNFRVADPFAMIAYESEQLDFFNAKMPAEIYLPRLDMLFPGTGAPEAYNKFLAKFLMELKIKHYHMKKNLTYWVVYSEI